MIAVEALPGVPEVRPGDDLAALLTAAATRLGGDPAGLRPTDVLVIAHKIVSKAEGRVVDLADVTPSPRALDWAVAYDKDARAVQVVLDDAAEVIRMDGGRIICRTRHGFVCANGGVDRSNAGAEERAILLPLDPDASACRLRAALGCAVVISDSFGRPWRIGQAEVAIGCAGLRPLQDERGAADRDGRLMHASHIAIADEAAQAADLARAKAGGQPAVRIRGLEAYVLDEDGPGAAALVRDLAHDLFT